MLLRDTIVLKSYIEDNFVNISVIDHGPGIDENNRVNIFKRFAPSSSNVNHKLPGTGLGLNLCKFIVEKHNGTIGFESEEGVGSEFYFKLPLTI